MAGTPPISRSRRDSSGGPSLRAPARSNGAALVPARPHQIRVLLGERHHLAGVLAAPVAPLTPSQHHRPETRSVHQPHHPPTQGLGHHPAARAPDQHRRRLDAHAQQVRPPVDGRHVQPLQTEHEITVVTAPAASAQGTAARRKVRNVEVLQIRRGRSPLILRDLDPSPPQHRAPARRHPTLKDEEPRIVAQWPRAANRRSASAPAHTIGARRPRSWPAGTRRSS